VFFPTSSHRAFRCCHLTFEYFALFIGTAVPESLKTQLANSMLAETITVIKEREPANRTTVIKKDRDNGFESKTIIHHDRD
jgi:hypothetical protein